MILLRIYFLQKILLMSISLFSKYRDGLRASSWKNRLCLLNKTLLSLLPFFEKDYWRSQNESIPEFLACVFLSRSALLCSLDWTESKRTEYSSVFNLY